jgi:hypothetical protein
MYDGNMAICLFKFRNLKQCYYPTLPGVHFESAPVNFRSWFQIRRKAGFNLLKFEHISNQSLAADKI